MNYNLDAMSDQEYSDYMEDVKTAAETMERILIDVLEHHHVNKTARVTYQGNHPDFGNLYHVDGEQNFYGWTWRELQTASRKTNIEIVVNK